MRLEFRDGLLFTSLTIIYKGKKKTVENIVINTGATQSIVSTDALEELGIEFEPGDQIVTCYGIGGRQYAVAKRVDGVTFGPFMLDERNIDIGPVDLGGKISGLLGLDLLVEVGGVIDLKNLLLFEGVCEKLHFRCQAVRPSKIALYGGCESRCGQQGDGSSLSQKNIARCD